MLFLSSSLSLFLSLSFSLFYFLVYGYLVVLRLLVADTVSACDIFFFLFINPRGSNERVNKTHATFYFSSLFSSFCAFRSVLRDTVLIVLGCSVDSDRFVLIESRFSFRINIIDHLAFNLYRKFSFYIHKR